METTNKTMDVVNGNRVTGIRKNVRSRPDCQMMSATAAFITDISK